MIAYHIVALALLFITGGYEVEFLDRTSTRMDPLLIGLFVSAAMRLGIHIGTANFALVAVSMTVAAGLGELALRALDLPISDPAMSSIHQPDAHFGFTLVPDSVGKGNLSEHIQINSFGARDHEFDDKDEDRLRIVALGDSFTFGYGVELEDAFVEQLETLLGQRGRPAEVFNLGVGSYQMWHHVEQLNRRVSALEPDLVLIAFFFDDLIAPLKPAVVQVQNPFQERVKDKFTGSKLWNTLRNIGNSIEFSYRHQRGYDYLNSIEERRAYIDERLADYRVLQTGERDAQIRPGVVSAARQIRSWSVENDVPVFSVYLPDASQVHQPERQYANRLLTEVLSRESMPWLDTTAAFEAQPELEPLFLFPLDAHTSPAGHRLIARTIADDAAFIALLNGIMAERENPSRGD